MSANFPLSAISNKDLRKLAQRASSANWHLQMTGGNHVKWTTPQGVVYITSLTPRTNKATYVMRSKLRQHGVSVDGGR